MKNPKIVQRQQEGVVRKQHEDAWQGQFIHPGEIIKRRFFEPLNVTLAKFCERTGIDKSKFNRILKGALKITPETANELSAAFGMSPMFFMNLQSQYDLALVGKKRQK